MNKRNKIALIIVIIIIIDLLALFYIMNLMSKLDLIIHDLFLYITTEFGFIFIFSILILIFSIPSILFNLKVLKQQTKLVDTEIIDNNINYKPISLKNKFLWGCNLLLSLLSLILGGYLLYFIFSCFRLLIIVPIPMILFSLLLISLGLIIIKDSLKIKNQSRI